MIDATLFDYSSLDTDTRVFLQELDAELDCVIKRSAKDIGTILLKAKHRLPHGHFMPWLASKGISESTSWRCMQIAQGKEIKGKSFIMKDLPLIDAEQSAGDKWDLLEKAAEKAVPIDPEIWSELNKTIEEVTSIEELKKIRDRTGKIQGIAAETSLRLSRRMGQLLNGTDEQVPVQKFSSANWLALPQEIRAGYLRLLRRAMDFSPAFDALCTALISRADYLVLVGKDPEQDNSCQEMLEGIDAAFRKIARSANA